MTENIKQIMSDIGKITGTIEELDELAVEIEGLSENQLSILKAYVKYQYKGCRTEAYQISFTIMQLPRVRFRPDIKTAMELGRYMVDELKMLSLDAEYLEFIDYEKYANTYGHKVGILTEDGLILGKISQIPF